ncbi:MAG: iron ABC transporter permease [Anaerolineae bacterium]|nr:iron ABC transporter permease [Anaerolineae bacterium]
MEYASTDKSPKDASQRHNQHGEPEKAKGLISPTRYGNPVRRQRLLWGLAALLVVTVVVAIFSGRYPAPYLMSPRLLAEDPLARQIVLNLRLPRILTAVLLGMTLAGAGTVFQMIFRNPLVEPGFLGVSQGAAFGAALSIVAWNAGRQNASGPGIQVSAATFGFLGLLLSSTLARRIRYGGWTLRLVLAGIAVSALFSAGVGILKYVADPLTQLPELVFWMLGALWSVTWSKALSILPVTVTALVLLLLLRWRLNLLALDDATAFSLGAAPARERMVLLIAAVAAVSVVVSVSGIVGWIGLIVPHLARRLLGADAQGSLPGALLIGGAFAVFCDTLARTMLPGEIPLGILASLIGASIFIALMLVQPRSLGHNITG